MANALNILMVAAENDALPGGKVGVSIDLAGDPTSGLVGYKAKRDAGVIDDDEPGAPKEDPSSDLWLVNEAIRVLGEASTDMTLFYRALADVPLDLSLDALRGLGSRLRFSASGKP